jgi:hypothetical protein
LTGAAEVPANTSKARGDAHFTYDTDTRQLSYSVTYEGLSASEADIHGPAGISGNAPVIVPFPVPDSPIGGTATLSSDQAKELLVGQFYVDVHSQAYANGEIRGQILKQ